MNAVELIEAKRSGMRHSPAEIEWLVTNCLTIDQADSALKPEQLSAWLMAVYFRGLDMAETAVLTDAMARSGSRIDLTGLPKPWVDKHSTGGVGDKTTLVLLPMLAACGLTVVKMSGRGLGKTGGTIDKLESITGFTTALTIEQLKAQAGRIGLALTGQTPELAPADGVLYAMRDITATVPSIPLIASSVLSKKIAGGADVISLDLKCGSGAFMEDLVSARNLREVLMAIGQALGLKIGVEITDMSQPLGKAVGNSIEVREAISVLTAGEFHSARFRELCIELCATTLQLAGVEPAPAEALAKSEAVLTDGTAAKKASEWIDAQGGRLDFDNLDSLPLAPQKADLIAKRSGYLGRLHAGMIGEAIIALGGGRTARGQAIDHSVGIEVHAEIGSEVQEGQAILTVYARTESEAQTVIHTLRGATEVIDGPISTVPVILG